MIFHLLFIVSLLNIARNVQEFDATKAGDEQMLVTPS